MIVSNKKSYISENRILNFCVVAFFPYDATPRKISYRNLKQELRVALKVMISGILGIKSSKVYLLKWVKYPDEWPSEQDNRPPVLEALHQLTWLLNQCGESMAGDLTSLLPKRSASIRQLTIKMSKWDWISLENKQ
jgi:hypothetical protein